MNGLSNEYDCTGDTAAVAAACISSLVAELCYLCAADITGYIVLLPPPTPLPRKQRTLYHNRCALLSVTDRGKLHEPTATSGGSISLF